MLLLTSTADKIQASQLTVTARTLHIHASWVDHLAGAVTPGRTLTSFIGAGPVDVVASPAASTQRNVQTLIVRNVDTVAASVTITHTDGTTPVELFAGVLLPSEQVSFIDGAGFHLTSPIEIANRSRLAVDFNSTIITPLVVSGLTKTLTVGTWVFRYTLIYRTIATLTGVRPDVNFTGSRNFFVFNARWVDLSTATSTGPDQDQTAATGAIMSAWARRAPSTAGLGPSPSVDTANADMLLIIEGAVDVTGAGDLELYWASEAAASDATLIAGSTLWLEPYGS